MTTRPPHPLLDFRHRRAVWLVLVVFLVGLSAPCVHCLTLASSHGAAPMKPAAPVAAAPAAPAMPEGMPADCPMHAAHAKKAAPEPVPAPAEAPCPKPGDCCLEQGKGPAATLDDAAPPPAPAVEVAAVASLDAPALPAPLLLPRELGSDRSHAPPAFNLPLRN